METQFANITVHFRPDWAADDRHKDTLFLIMTEEPVLDESEAQ